MDNNKLPKEFGMTINTVRGQDKSMKITIQIASSEEISEVNQKKISKLLSKVTDRLLEEPNKKLRIFIPV